MLEKINYAENIIAHQERGVKIEAKRRRNKSSY
jgi:hypothetical protein